MKGRRFYLTVLLTVLAIGLQGLNTLQAQEIAWKSMEEATRLSQQDGKKILVDLYTDWCQYCKKMKRVTYREAAVVAYINAHFHAVKFNTEKDRDSLTIGDRVYRFLPEVGREGIHEWPLKMMAGRPMYPSTVFLTSSARLITTVPEYRKPKEMLILLHFIQESAYEHTSWTKFKSSFRP
ncbi:MAG: thioredoxin family protein [Bacteroidota bacterium]